MKIAYIGQKGILNPSGGGVETHVQELSLKVAEKGHTVFLYTRPYYTPKEYRKYEKVNLISLPSIHTKHLDAISHTFIATLHALKNKVDIIHYHGVGPSLLTFLPRILAPKIKVVSTAHSEDWQHSKWNWFACAMLKFGAFMSANFAHEVLTVSKNLQNKFLVDYKKSISLIPNGVSVNQTNKIGQNLLNKFDIKKKRYILVVSRLVKHKGIHYLIEAFKQLKSGGEFGDFKLVIVGQTAFTDNYFEFLKKMIKDRDDIIFTGSQRGEMLEQLFFNAYLYVSASESEGLSVALLEAMNYGTAPLVSDISANLELIEGDVNFGSVGFVFKNKNIIDLQKKLKLLLSHPNIVMRVGRKAKEFVKIYYNWEDVANRVDQVYLRLSAKKLKNGFRERFRERRFTLAWLR